MSLSYQVSLQCLLTTNVGIPRCKFYGAIMGLPLIKLVFFVLPIVGIATGQAKVNEEYLVFSARLVSDQQVGCLDVSMDVLLAMDVFQHIQLEKKIQQ